MLFSELKNQLKTGKLNNNKFILYSKNEYSIRTSLNLFKKLVQNSDLNVSEIDVQKIEKAEEIIAKCETIPFMSTRRLIIIRSSFLEPENKDKLNIVKSLEKYIKTLPNFTTLVLYFYQKDKREKISKNKNVKKLELKGATLVTNNTDESQEVKFLLNNFLKENKITIDNAVSNYIITNCKNIDMLINDLDKLKFIENIDIDIVKDLFDSIEEDDLWDLTDAISNKNGVLALEIINNLLPKGIQPIKIVYNLSKQYKLLMYCKIELLNKKREEEIAKKLNLKPYVCSILCKKTKKYSLSKLASNLEKCIKLEVKIKSISMDTKSELEMLLVKALL